MSTESKIPERTTRNCGGFLVTNPAWIDWADDRIASLEAQLAAFERDFEVVCELNDLWARKYERLQAELTEELNLAKKETEDTLRQAEQDGLWTGLP